MDITNTEPVREDALEDKIQMMMKVYPNLDWLMARTILQFSEEELAELIEKSKNAPKQDRSQNMVIKSVLINGE